MLARRLRGFLHRRLERGQQYARVAEPSALGLRARELDRVRRDERPYERHERERLARSRARARGGEHLISLEHTEQLLPTREQRAAAAIGVEAGGGVRKR